MKSPSFIHSYFLDNYCRYFKNIDKVKRMHKNITMKHKLYKQEIVSV